MTPNLLGGINLQSPQSDSTPWTLTLKLMLMCMDITLSLKQVSFQKRNFSTPWRKYHANSRKASNVCNPRQKALKKHIKPNWQTKHSKGSKNSYFSLIFYDLFLLFLLRVFWESSLICVSFFTSAKYKIIFQRTKADTSFRKWVSKLDALSAIYLFHYCFFHWIGKILNY